MWTAGQGNRDGLTWAHQLWQTGHCSAKCSWPGRMYGGQQTGELSVPPALFFCENKTVLKSLFKTETDDTLWKKKLFSNNLWQEVFIHLYIHVCRHIQDPFIIHLYYSAFESNVKYIFEHLSLYRAEFLFEVLLDHPYVAFISHSSEIKFLEPPPCPQCLCNSAAQS